MIILALGVLTHYYFIVYTFFLYCVVLWYCLIKREIKTLFRVVYSAIISGGIVVAIFPGIFFYMLKEGRGPENIQNFFNLTDYWMRVKEYFEIVSKDMFGGMLLLSLMLGIWWLVEKICREDCAKD